MADPIGDAEGAEFGEVAVVEDQDEVTGLVAETLQHVAVAAREVPDVAGVEIVGLGEAAWIDDGGADAALENERPFGRGGVPVQFAHRAGLQPHRHAGDPLGDRQLRDGRLLAVAVADDLALRLLQRELECRQILARERWVRNIVHEARVAAGGRLGPTQRGQRDYACGGQKLPALRIGHDALPAVQRNAPTTAPMWPPKKCPLDHKGGADGWACRSQTTAHGATRRQARPGRPPPGCRGLN
jgi:hypothetical protein